MVVEKVKLTKEDRSKVLKYYKSNYLVFFFASIFCLILVRVIFIKVEGDFLNKLGCSSFILFFASFGLYFLFKTIFIYYKNEKIRVSGKITDFESLIDSSSGLDSNSSDSYITVVLDDTIHIKIHDFKTYAFVTFGTIQLVEIEFISFQKPWVFGKKGNFYTGSNLILGWKDLVKC